MSPSPPSPPAQGLQGFKGPPGPPPYVPQAGYCTPAMGSIPGGQVGLLGVVGSHSSAGSDVVLCRACQASPACWDAR